jgi:pimeloyl-ACP methyl ester carboxylesterase
VAVPDGPGYGDSDPWRDRQAVDEVRVFDAIADEEKFPTYAVIGVSGGGVPAICSSPNPRVTHVGAFAAPGMRSTDDLDFFRDMEPSNVREFSLSPDDLDVFLKARARRMRADQRHLLGSALQSGLTDDDRASLEIDDLATRLDASYAYGVRRTHRGWVDDDLTFVHPDGLGVDISTAQCPVVLVQSRDDVWTPPQHAVWYLQHLAPEYGHLIMVPGGHLGAPHQIDHMLEYFVHQDLARLTRSYGSDAELINGSKPLEPQTNRSTELDLP